MTETVVRVESLKAVEGSWVFQLIERGKRSCKALPTKLAEGDETVGQHPPQVLQEILHVFVHEHVGDGAPPLSRLQCGLVQHPSSMHLQHFGRGEECLPPPGALTCNCLMKCWHPWFRKSKIARRTVHKNETPTVLSSWKPRRDARLGTKTFGSTHPAAWIGQSGFRFRDPGPDNRKSLDCKPEN